MDELRFRQIHLDFHTSGLIGDVGNGFDADAFADTLERANVDSVTCFARCHHGMIYYDSRLFPERNHPGLGGRNLLKEQVDACHKRNIKTPVYITVQWDQYTAAEKPEWLMREPSGAPVGQAMLDSGFYQKLCVNTPYRQFLREHTGEILRDVDADGIFYDIVITDTCACAYCVADMEKKGLNPLLKDDRLAHYKEVLREFKSEMTEFVHSIRPEITVFYNCGHISFETRDTMDSYTHFELESLPSGEWGYMHFPVTMRYARSLGKDCLGHTGKFHTSWGDFHSFKNKEALEYECLRMLALNAKCLIGDQLEPPGVLSAPVYDLIGGVYSMVREREPWCRGAVPETEIGVMAPDEFSHSGIGSIPGSMTGAARLLEQCSFQFDFIDSTMDFNKYRLLVLPDEIPVDERLGGKISEYIRQGGKVLASYMSGMDTGGNAFNLGELCVRVMKTTTDDLGVPVRGRFAIRNDFADYVLPEGIIGGGLNPTEHVMYARGIESEAVRGGKAEIGAIEPYFVRSYKHYCSHRQAPSSGKRSYDAVVSTKNTVYFSHPVFGIYNRMSPGWVKTMVSNAVGMLLGERLIEHDGPSGVLATVNRQPEGHRFAIHILYYIPERKSTELDIIEDVVPLHNLHVRLRLPENVKSLSAAAGGTVGDVVINGGDCSFTVPVLNGSILVEAVY
ncbi:MAG: beta-galactosidase trimerization domain-containing protein [Clostridia bacterium]|nr:beta-galactosidase trimerization domain-containing protein [Clostridia bacterium]